jgi:23S rRNA pseudouridine1911/1915/1917 synthase
MNPRLLSLETDPQANSSEVFEAAPEDAGRRLDVVVVDRVPRLSRSRVAHLAEAGLVAVDGIVRKPSFRLRAGQTVRVEIPPPPRTELRPEPIPLRVVYEDADLVVVDKPPGLTVHPGPGHPSGTLVNALLARAAAPRPDGVNWDRAHGPRSPTAGGAAQRTVGEAAGEVEGGLAPVGDAVRPGIVHRLDKDTSGLLVVAKTESAYRSLAAQLRARTMVRMYLALVRGQVARDHGTIRAPVGRHPSHRTRQAVSGRGRPAVTHYRVLERFRDSTWLACRLETGRTHQIRVHMAHMGHPVLGDPVYGHARVPDLERQALHAARLEFSHPSTATRLVCTAPLPEDMARLLARLRNAGASEPCRAGSRPRMAARHRGRRGGGEQQ